MSFFYKPADGIAADFIPFYWDNTFHLFYLKDYRDEANHGKGTPWFHLETNDFVHFTERGEALARGPVDAQDLWVFTGSVIEANDGFQIFYTGHNQLFEQRKPIQAVMRATSPDLQTWTKDDSFLFFAPEGYEVDDWRDPFVFWNEQADEYWMLLAARTTTGPSRNRGCVALATSPDLNQWTVAAPFWAPSLYFTHECPDLFQIGDWWYLVYSTFSERVVTHYRMSRSLQGPWLTPANDTFDARAFYAAKTASDGQRRFAFGWLPTRVDERDDGSWQWGGHLVVHEIVQEADGTLSVRMPESVHQAFNAPVKIQPRPVLGDWQIHEDHLSADAISRHSALYLGDLPKTCLIELELKLTAGTVNAGVLLRANAELNSYYQIRIEPLNSRLVFDRWPRPGDQPFMLERLLETAADRPIKLQIIVDGTCVVAYVDDKIACSSRMYEHRTGGFGLFVSEGKADFSNLRVLERR
jgi:beta-fructofuranosidase